MPTSQPPPADPVPNTNDPSSTRDHATTTTVLRTRRPALGLMLILSTVTGLIGFLTLMTGFGWPDVLDDPGTQVLATFAQHESLVRGAFYCLLISSMLLIPAAVYLQHSVGRDRPGTRAVAAFGIVAAAFQILGWVRWPLVVPGLAERFTDPGSDAATRAATAASYDLINSYAGSAVGEHLGWLFQGVWALGVGVLLLRSSLPRWVGSSGLVLSIAWAPFIVLSIWVPAFGEGVLGAVSVNAYAVWYVWLGVLGVAAWVGATSRPSRSSGSAQSSGSVPSLTGVVAPGLLP